MMRKTEMAVLFVLLAATFSLGFFTSDFYKQSAANNIGLASLVQLPEKTLSASIDIVAVSSDGTTGSVNTATVEIQDGQGRALFSLNPFVEPDTQQSAETAKSVAEAYTKTSLSGKDVIYTIDAGNAQLVGGPSAGAALTAATIAAIEEKTINKNVEITGTINPDGSIGQIGGVLEKMSASAEKGKTLFLVPVGQGTLSYYEPRVTRQERNGFVIERTTYVPKTLNLNDYAKQQGWNIEIKEVADISEAVRYLL
ncbi:MAG: hypothetical protein PHH08_00870 [Candidatus ainarchaeum sp.]|nr:hypothetical protein [Candidatus ainarchaeum sp.]